jgi:fructuronate reductase
MSKFKTKIIHLGLGRFHRGHQAVYLERLLEKTGESWGVISCSMRSQGARDEMRSVHNRYPVIEFNESGSDIIWVESIQKALDATEDREELLGYFQSKETELVTLTITEKGYCLNGKGELDLSHPAIFNDLKHPLEPKSAIGILALGLRTRSENDPRPITVLSCDNLRENGKKLERALYTYLEKLSWSDVTTWVKSNVSFPCSMVDRIVPSLKPEKIKTLEVLFKLAHPSELIATESFSQWVVEDNFKGKKPSLEKVGVQFVKDVTPFEDMKLRLLNAAHSYLAYQGQLKGHQFVHEAMKDSELASDLRILMLEEVAPLLTTPEGVDFELYVASLLKRFQNPYLPHELRQIAMDGSQKISQRWLPSLIEAEKRGTSKKILLKAVKAWLEFCYKNQKLDDPMNDRIQEISRENKQFWIEKMLALEVFTLLEKATEIKLLLRDESL